MEHLHEELRKHAAAWIELGSKPTEVTSNFTWETCGRKNSDSPTAAKSYHDVFASICGNFTLLNGLSSRTFNAIDFCDGTKATILPVAFTVRSMF